MELKGKRVLVTGASSFLGKHLVQKLQCEGLKCLILNLSPNVKYTLLHSYYQWQQDLTNSEEVDCLFDAVSNDGPIDYVFHLAGYNGGIQVNAREPASVFMRSTLMGLNVLEACHRYKVGKVVSVVASCAYPQFEIVGGYTCVYREKGIYRESDFLDSPPHDSVACHGYAKRNLQLASRFYNKQHNDQFVCVCPPTLYGPGDRLDLERTKVMMGIIKKVCDAKYREDKSVTFFGSGSPLRDFLYVEDAANLLIRAALCYTDSHVPLNIGAGHELTVGELATLICWLAEYQGEILWDKTRPDGAHRKRLDTTRMKAILGEHPFVPLAEGIKRTISWYRGLTPPETPTAAGAAVISRECSYS